MSGPTAYKCPWRPGAATSEQTRGEPQPSVLLETATNLFPTPDREYGQMGIKVPQTRFTHRDMDLVDSTAEGQTTVTQSALVLSTAD